MITWQIADRFRDIFTPDDLQRFAVDRDGCGEQVVRQLDSRTTCRISTPSGFPDIFVKKIHLGLFQHSRKATAEWQNGLKLNRLDTGTHPMIALGIESVSFFKKNIYIVTEEIKGAVTLHDYCINTASGFSATAVLSFARFIKRLHSKGILHTDLHWKNILITNRADPEFFIIDPAGIIFKKEINIKEAVSNLALLNLSFDGRIHDRYGVMFVNEYFRGKEDKKKRMNQIIKKTRHLQHMKRKRRLKRYVSDNKYFCPIRINNISGYCRRDYLNDTLINQLSRNSLLTEKSICIKQSRTTTVFLNHDTGMFIKIYNYKGILNSFKNSLYPSRAKRAWMKSNALFDMNISTPMPMFFFNRTLFGCVVLYSVFAAEIIPRAKTLKQFYETDIYKASYKEKQGVIKKLAGAITCFHHRGFFHGDMKEKNILMTEDRKIYFTDCDSLRFKKNISPDQKIRDINRLNISLHTLPEKIRKIFFKYYLVKNREYHADRAVCR